MEHLMIFALAFIAGGAGGASAWFLARRVSRREMHNVIVRYDRETLPRSVARIAGDPRVRG